MKPKTAPEPAQPACGWRPHLQLVVQEVSLRQREVGEVQRHVEARALVGATAQHLQTRRQGERERERERWLLNV